MAANQQTYINGNRFSFPNIQLTFQLPTGGVQVLRGAFKSINYECTQDPGIVQGNQVAPVGRTAGYATCTGNFEMLKQEFDLLCIALTQAGNVPIMGTDFNFQVSYNVNEVDVRTDALLGARITSIASNNASGNDASTTSCNLSIMQLFLNGLPAFAAPGQG